jgi:glycine/D-amino acid oxidase-like deaminating enzyme
MKPLRDPLGRPIRRIYLKTDVLDRRCEGIIREFMNRRSGGYRLPIPTDELVRLIEERAAKVDTYADLPEGIHGRRSLFYDRARIVKIAESIYRTRSDHRVRTTICHAYLTKLTDFSPQLQRRSLPDYRISCARDSPLPDASFMLDC